MPDHCDRQVVFVQRVASNDRADAGWEVRQQAADLLRDALLGQNKVED
jgi:hypothetical protein